jgi:hypothetical protein
VHDRTVNGEALVFGNQGALFMNAMTWWDHETDSIWSQPWGRAISGPLKGTELELLPSQLVPWGTWKAEYPDTLALSIEGLTVFGSGYGRAQFRPGYVIGVALGDSASAFPYEQAAEEGVVNDFVGPYPLLVHVDLETHAVHTYLRQVDDRALTFFLEDGAVQDAETGSTWQMDRGLAVEGPLQGQALLAVPYIPAFHSAWEDFYPHSLWYDGHEEQ